MTVYTKQFDILHMIYEDQPDLDLVSPSHPDFEAWKWDYRHWANERLENNYMIAGTPVDQNDKNIPIEYWQAGVASLNDLEVIGPTTTQEGQTEKWTVSLHTGDYFQIKRLKHLFSDNARIEYMYSEVLVLAALPKPNGMITIQNWIRDDADQHRIYTQLQKRLVLSESLDRQEFIVEYENEVATIQCNKDYTFDVGLDKGDPVAHADNIYWYDSLGARNDKNSQVLYTKYFPIDSSRFILYTERSGAITLIDSADYVIDYDRGEIVVGLSYLEGTEYIEGDNFYAGYRVLLEVEYEPDTDQEEVVIPIGLNMDPLAAPLNRGFIYLSETELRAATVELEVLGLPQLGANLYGPLSIGGEFCTLKATVKSQAGQPVPGVAVTFSFSEDRPGIDQGSINGAESVIALTGSYGEAYSTYITPYSADILSGISVHEESGPEAQNHLEIPADMLINVTELSDIFVYAIYNIPTEAGGTYNPITGLGGIRIIQHRWADGRYNYLKAEDGFVVHSLGFDDRPGAVMPVRPTSIAGTKLVFKSPDLTLENNLPWTDPNAEGFTTPVAYWICGISLAKFKASCISYITNTEITSNIASIKTQLPENRRGIKIIDDVIREKIPIGYRFLDPTSLEVVATSLDGATFIKIASDTTGDLTNEFDINIP